jgi:hypothetical protein
MRLASVFLFVSFFFLFTPRLSAQDLGPHFKKIKEGIFVRTAKPTDSNAAIILMHQSVVPIALLQVAPGGSGGIW